MLYAYFIRKSHYLTYPYNNKHPNESGEGFEAQEMCGTTENPILA